MIFEKKYGGLTPDAKGAVGGEAANEGYRTRSSRKFGKIQRQDRQNSDKNLNAVQKEVKLND